VAPTLRSGLDDAHRVMDDLARVGVDVAAVMRKLEREAIEKFTTSIDDAYKGIAAKVKTLGGEQTATLSPR